MAQFTQGVKVLNVYLNTGNFNVILKAVVGPKAYLALHNPDGDLSPDNSLANLYFPSDIRSVDINNGPDFPLRLVYGMSWYNVEATTGMRVVMWDTTPSNPNLNPMYVCRIKYWQDCARDDSGIPEADRLRTGGGTHAQYLNSFRTYVNTKNWNIQMSGNLTTSAWIGLYQDNIKYPAYDNWSNWIGIRNIPGTIHRAGGDYFYMFEGSSWFNIRGTSPCYFGIWDYMVGVDRTVKLRAVYHARLLLAVERHNFYESGPRRVPGVVMREVPPMFGEVVPAGSDA